MAEKGKTALAGIDIGTSRIVAVIAFGPSLVPAGVGLYPTVGMRRGVISHMDGVARCVREAVERAENIAGVKVSEARLGFTGYTTEIIAGKSKLTTVKERKVNQEDLDKLKRLAAMEELPAGRQILKIIPVEYTVNKTPGVKDPRGMRFKSLELDARILTVESKLIDELVNILHRANIKALDYTPSTVAAAAGVLKSAEMQLGTALIDFGASTTGMVLYNYGCQAGIDVVPAGGDLITSDLAVGLRTTREAAEGVKKQIGLKGSPDVRSIEVPGINRSGTHTISVDFAKKIIEARVSEILDLVKARITKYAGDMELPGGLVLTGGGAAMCGLADFTAGYLGMPVRIGSISISGVDEAGISHLSCSAAIGLLNPGEKGERPGTLVRNGEGMWQKIKEVFRLQV